MKSYIKLGVIFSMLIGTAFGADFDPFGYDDPFSDQQQICPDGYHHENGYCVQDPPNPDVMPCPQGYHWDSGKMICVPDLQQQCPEGYYFENGNCIPDQRPKPDVIARAHSLEMVVAPQVADMSAIASEVNVSSSGSGHTVPTGPPLSGVLLDAGPAYNIPAEPTTGGTKQAPTEATAFGCSPGMLCSQGTSPNAFWIVERGVVRVTHAEVTLGSSNEEEIIPAISSDLIVYEIDPNGQVQQYSPGEVERGKKYTWYFTADSLGKNKVVYWVKDHNNWWWPSNTISFDVT